MSDKPTVNIAEAAALMNVHPETALQIVQSGAIPAAKVGRAYVMMTRDVLTYVQAKIAKQTAERMRRVPTTARRPKKTP